MNVKKIVCMGDSLTAAYDLKDEQGWTPQLSEILGVEVVNKGISGDTTVGMLARFQKDVIDQSPSHVIIMGGTNDLWHKLANENIISNIMAMIRHAKHHGIVSVIGIPPSIFTDSTEKGDEIFLSNFELSERLVGYQDYLVKMAESDGRDIMDFRSHLSKEHFLADEIHMNETGHAIMAKAAADKLTNLTY